MLAAEASCELAITTPRARSGTPNSLRNFERAERIESTLIAISLLPHDYVVVTSVFLANVRILLNFSIGNARANTLSKQLQKSR
jgi:hypothetical protein